YIGLLHYPMRNRRGEVVTTSVTNLDLHDIARAARSFGVEGFLVVHPSPSQHELINHILDFWQEGFGGQYNADRRDAFERVQLCHSLEEAKAAVAAQHPGPLYTVATTAHRYEGGIAHRAMRNRLKSDQGSYLLLFGTGFGMDEAFLKSCDMILEPIDAGGGYNHLSVRSAVSILLDRLLGEPWFEG
ncbi:MAG: RNA methyltransferase, partial [Syntrophomonadaceae bacterium]|nr:RNA methyltransferase [Syntrophomonadaceae bacterium]